MRRTFRAYVLSIFAVSAGDRTLQRFLLLCGIALALAGCVSAAPHTPRPPELIQHHAVKPVEDVDVLAVTPKMRRFVDRYVSPYDGKRLRAALLVQALQDKGVFGFHYNDFQTLTAAEAFERRSGNCLAFANLYVALAREAGLDARYQDVFIEPEWSSKGDTLLVAKHVNVLIRDAGEHYMIDVSGQEIYPDARHRPMDDDEARALFFNNHGAKALIEDDRAGAYAHFARAIQIDPTLPDVWSNLGVLLGRNGQAQDAELAYRHALALNEREMSAMGNLHDLYLEQGRVEEAEQMDRRVERYRRENPYYLLHLSDEAVAEGRLEQAARLLRRAIRIKETEHLLHYAKARVEFLSGERTAAEASLQRARELAPPELSGEYQRPLEELLAWQESVIGF